MDHLDDQPDDNRIRPIYFGPHWGAPTLDGARRVATPIGQHCILCGEPVVENDRGFMRGIAYVRDRKPVADVEPVHAECEILPILGHMLGVCPCTGYPINRDSARLAWQRMQLGGGRDHRHH